MTALIIAVYLIGCVVNYVFIKWLNKIQGEPWTIRDRAIAIKISLFSYIAFAYLLSCYISEYIEKNGNRPAKW